MSEYSSPNSSQPPSTPIGSLIPSADSQGAKSVAPARGRDETVRVGPTYRALATAAVLISALGWAYWPTLLGLAHSWVSDPDSGHGPLVLAFSGYLAWQARGRVTVPVDRPSLWGLLLLLLAGGLRAAGSIVYSTPLDQLSLLPTAVGVIWAVFGWNPCRALLPAIGFTFFAIPLHGRIGYLYSHELQTFASAVSTYLLQTAGIPAQREGNVIVLSEVDLGVVEACSGLRMMMSFLAIATAVSMLLRRPVWQRLVVVSTAVPVGLACNVLRITATGILHETADRRWADFVFHDLAGWLMMPLALGFIWVEVVVLNRLIIRQAATPVAARPRPVVAAI